MLVALLFRMQQQRPWCGPGATLFVSKGWWLKAQWLSGRHFVDHGSGAKARVGLEGEGGRGGFLTRVLREAAVVAPAVPRQRWVPLKRWPSNEVDKRILPMASSRILHFHEGKLSSFLLAHHAQNCRSVSSSC